LRPVLARIARSSLLDLQLVVGGTHLEPRFGSSRRLIEADGFPIAATVEMNLADDSPAGIARSAARAHAGFAEAFARLVPETLLLFGDRFDVHAAAVAAVPFGIPIAHVHGGELTFGAFDDCFRHSITKLSHLHFTATDVYRNRVIQMGEEPWRVQTTGAPGIDAVLGVRPLSPAALKSNLGLVVDPAPLLVTFHPVTLQSESTAAQIDELLAALSGFSQPVVFTAPNADTRNSVIRARISSFVAERSNARLVENLDTAAYTGLMWAAAAMVGNSSSGLIEAPSFGLPVVNVGDRQAGRLRAENVIDVPCERKAIEDAVRKAVEPEFRKRLTGCPNPYGDGRASERIVARLEQRESRERLISKQFYEFGGGAWIRATA
jgi:UDP-N-acetylglucosamine 2-epimerase (non-hydrolysing)/GDP/UDP-N,N'-diacetylbacillosamine 2-epimerase (hydrolysing)